MNKSFFAEYSPWNFYNSVSMNISTMLNFFFLFCFFWGFFLFGLVWVFFGHTIKLAKYVQRGDVKAELSAAKA